MRLLPIFVFTLAVLKGAAAGLPGPAVWSVQIEITADHARSLREKPREYVPAKVRILDETLEDVTIRLKGTGSFQPLDQKPSFTLDLQQFGRSDSFRGITKIHLNNSAEDPSYLKERIGSEMFARAGIAVPRVGHARVTVNGRPLGLYVMKEGFTREFLRRSFQESDGKLYDPEDGGDVDQAMQREIGAPGAGEQEELKRLATAANDPDLARRWEGLKSALDVDQFLTFMAIELMISHWDGYCLSRNNFRVYYQPGRDKILFLPAGMDQIFAKADLPWNLPMAGMVAKAIRATDEGDQRYDRKFRTLFESHFDERRLTNQVSELLAALEPFLRETESAAIRSEARFLNGKIVQRGLSLREQLASAAPTVPTFVNGAFPLSGWTATDKPPSGKMIRDGAALQILAGSRTAAAWRTTVRLKPGRYVFQGDVRASGVRPLPFGARQGAVLRVVGTTAQSQPLVGTSNAAASCGFQVDKEAEVVLACELRASAGEATFQNLAIRRRE